MTALPAYAKIMITSAGPYRVGFGEMHVNVLIDKCVITQARTFEEVHADKFKSTFYCRDFDDPTGTVFPIIGMNYNRPLSKPYEANP